MHDTITLSTQDHQELLQRLAMGMFSITPRVQELIQYISEDTSRHVRDVWEPTEITCLFLLLSAFLLRGASAGTISRYITTDSADLPFCGCEQELFDNLLNSMRAAASDPDFLDRASVEFSALIDEIIRRLSETSGIARPVLYQLFFRGRTHE